MKLIKIKPRLVDHALLQGNVPIPRLKPKIVTPNVRITSETPNLSGWFNLIGILILCIAGLIIYNRYTHREQVTIDKTHSILGFTQYVNEVKETLKQEKSEPGINNL